MPVSPQEFSLWARMTGNKYPNSVEEKARLAPEVHNFSQNVGKQGALGVQEEPEPEQKSNLGSNLAKGALIAGGIAAGVAAARNPGVQEAVKTASGKASDFISRITTPREVNVDTAEAVRDVTNSAPGDTYSQAIIPTHQRVEGYAPAGLLKGGGIGGAGDRAQSLIAEIASKYGTNGADEEYVHPSRIPGMPGGDYRGRRLDTEAPSAQLRDARRDNEAGLFNRYQETGELPPSAVTPEMKAALSQSDVTSAIDQIKNDRLLDQKATEGTLTRAEEGAWLQNELNRSGTTPQELFGHDSIEAYMDTYMPKERSEVNRARDYEQDQQMQGDAYKRSLANVEASGEPGVSGGSGGTGQTSLSGQADEFIGAMQGPMPPEISLGEADSMQDYRSSLERQAFDKFVLENKEAIERGEIDPYSEQYHFNQPSLSDAYPNPWAEDQEDIIREAAKENALYKDAAQYKDRDPVSGYSYADIQDKLNEISGKVDPVEQEINNIVSKGNQVRAEAEWQRKSDEDWEAWEQAQEKDYYPAHVWEAHQKEQSLSNKADAVVSALGAAHPEFGNTVYSQPESVEAANADPGQNPINTALSGPTTPGNNVPTIQSTNDPGTLTGQHQIQIAADNAVDQVETDIIAIRRAELEAKKAQIAESTGLSNPAVDRFLGQYFPSMTETYSDVDIASGRTPERTVSNIGPEAEITKAASGGAIRGRSRVQDYEIAQDRTRDISPEPEELRGTPLPENRPDIIGGRLPLGGLPGDLDTSEMSKQEVIQSIINPSTVDLRDKTPIAGTGVYGREKGYVSGAMKASGEYSDAAMRKPTDLSPAEAKYERFSKDPYAGLSDEALQTHIQNARPGSPSQQGLQREAYRRSGTGIPISQKMREIHTTGDPLTRSERAQAFLDELRRNQQG